MPTTDGHEAARRICRAAQQSRAHTAIIALTAIAMAGDGERCFGAGMNGSPTKPINQPTLLETLSHRLAVSPPVLV